MFLLSAQNNFCIIMSSYVERHIQKNFKYKFHVFGWFPSLQNLHVFLGKFTAEPVLKSFLGRDNSLKLPFLDFVIVFHFFLKNQESWVLWWDGFCSNRHSKKQKSSAGVFFLTFLSCHYWFMNCFEILNFVFFNYHN